MLGRWLSVTLAAESISISSTVEQQLESTVRSDADSVEVQDNVLEPETPPSDINTAVAVWQPLKLPTAVSALLSSTASTSNYAAANPLTNTGSVLPTVPHKHHMSAPRNSEASACESEPCASQLQLQWRNSTCPLNNGRSPLAVAPISWQGCMFPTSTTYSPKELGGNSLHDTSWFLNIEELSSQEAAATAAEAFKESLQLVRRLL